jgi:hypothetical protein
MCSNNFADLCKEKRGVPFQREATEGGCDASHYPKHKGVQGMDEFSEAVGLDLLEVTATGDRNPWFERGIPFQSEHWKIEVKEIKGTEEVRAGEG